MSGPLEKVAEHVAGLVATELCGTDFDHADAVKRIAPIIAKALRTLTSCTFGVWEDQVKRNAALEAKMADLQRQIKEGTDG